jgi:transposase
MPSRPARTAMVILDQAGWHTTRKLKIPKNLTMVSLPRACPELNAAENIWQYLRQIYLSNCAFKTYTDILDACQQAWQKLLGGPAVSPPSRRAIGQSSIKQFERWYKSALRP